MPAPRPCPFCGSWRVGVQHVDRTYNGRPQYAVTCECGARGPIATLPEPSPSSAYDLAAAEATQRWDERAVLLRAVVDVPSDGVIYFSEGGVLRVRYPDGRVV